MSISSTPGTDASTSEVSETTISDSSATSDQVVAETPVIPETATVDPVVTSVETAVAPAPAPVIASSRYFNFTEITIVSPASEQLAIALTGKDANGNDEVPNLKKHFFISADAASASSQINEWGTGKSTLTVFGSMDANGTLKRPIVLGQDLGLNSIAIIHVSGTIIHNLDANGALVGSPQMQAFDTFQPQPPAPVPPAGQQQ